MAHLEGKITTTYNREKTVLKNMRTINILNNKTTSRAIGKDVSPVF